MNARLLPQEIAAVVFRFAHQQWSHAVNCDLAVTIRPLLSACPQCGAVTTGEHIFNRVHGRCSR